MVIQVDHKCDHFRVRQPPAALLKNVPMGCPDSVIPEPLQRNNQVNYLI